MSLQEMASKGAQKMTRKAGQMQTSYSAALGRAEANYRAKGFGPTRTSNYASGIRDGASRYHVDVQKWQTNWLAMGVAA